ncbi:DUF4142 domain-containing protein [Sphingobium sp.]|uniref:DUF4142 domain-containing protein n=1 Tax=Sphingobium sp. TaxID=1912891 RepID=UPI002D805E60|nr:DUF4142 domain-containing protein [Sphingobium sp.]
MRKIGFLTGCALSLMVLPACQDRQNASATNDGAALDSTANAAGPDAMQTNTTANDMATMNPAAQASSASDYLAKAGAGDLFEIESSRAVLDKTKDARVREFANMMVKAHQQSTAKLKAAAAEANLSASSPALTPDQQTMLDAIKSAPADKVDAVYVEHQKSVHDAALKLHQGYAANGDVATLKRAAGDILPVVESHIRQLTAMPSK